MFSWLRNWGPGTLAASWTAYWVALGTATLWTPVGQVLRLSKLGEGHSSMTAGFTNALLQLSMREDGNVVYSGSAHMVTIALWVAVPPLLLWVAWLRARPATENATQLLKAQDAQQFGAGDAGFAARPFIREPEKGPQRNSADGNRI